MEQPFYRGHLLDRHGIEVAVPDVDDRATVHTVIFEELCRGQIKGASRSRYLSIMARMVSAGAEGVILGCTEIGLLVARADSSVPLFDTTQIHAEAAVDFALQEI